MKRLIEMDFPIFEVSRESAREKSIRHGHISTLHIWWARRPLAACRAAIFASLVPTPAGMTERIPEYIKFLLDTLPKAPDEKDLPAPRPGCFFVYAIKCKDDSFYIGHTEDLVRRWDEHLSGRVSWTKGRKPLELIHWEEYGSREEAVEREKHLKTGFGRKWLKREYAAGRTRQAGGEWDAMKAHKRLVKFTADLAPWEVTRNKQLIDKARKIILVGKAVIDGLRDKELQEVIDGKREVDPPKVLDPFAGGGSIPLEALRLGCETYAMDYNPVAVLILKATLEYPQKYGKKLVEDVKKWGNWVLEEVRKEIGQFYPEEGDPGQRTLLGERKKGGWVPVGYIWARTMVCQNPSCGAEIPLMRQFWLRRKDRDGKIDWRDSIYLHPLVDKAKKRVEFEVVNEQQIEGFDPSKGTRPTARARATFQCPICGATYRSADLRKYGKNTGFGQRMICVILHNKNKTGKKYRIATQKDVAVYEAAAKALDEKVRNWDGEYSLIPDEPLPADGTLGFRVNKYGLKSWGELFNARQLLGLVTFGGEIKKARETILAEYENRAYADAVTTLLAMILSRCVDFSTSLSEWHNTWQFVAHVFSRQAIPMKWDYAELNLFSPVLTGTWQSMTRQIIRPLQQLDNFSSPGSAYQGSAASPGGYSQGLEAVITDPPYYDNVPYSDLSDLFYVWLKRTLGNIHEDLLSTPLTPKSEEIIQEPMRHGRHNDRAKQFYEEMMGKAFIQMNNALATSGVTTIVFAHKTTDAWETLVNALLQAGFVPTSSWPVHTEMGARLRARDSAALASSFFLACRKREGDKEAYFKDIRKDLHKRIHERLDHFWEQGIRGADFFISAIGPAVEVFGRYAKVKKISGEEVTVAELLDEVRKEVTEYALSRILHGIKLEKIDPMTRFYILWRWTYNGETIAYDDGRKLAQAVGIELDDIRGRDKLVSGKDKITVAKPQERDVDAIATRAPVNMVDALQKACLLWDADRTKDLQEFLADTGYADDPSFWETAQALSELLPDGDKEKQMLQGLLMKAPTVAAAAEKQLTLDKRWED